VAHSTLGHQLFVGKLRYLDTFRLHAHIRQTVSVAD
jgi:hypothetical protein